MCSKSLPFLSHLLLQHFVAVVHRLASSVHTPPSSTVSGCVGETSWALQCMFDQKCESRWIAQMCAPVMPYRRKWPDYQLIMSKMVMYLGLYFDLETFKAIAHSVRFWTRSQLFRFWARQGSGSEEQGSYTRGASSFPLEVADWIQRETCLFHLLHRFHPFTSPTTT